MQNYTHAKSGGFPPRFSVGFLVHNFFYIVSINKKDDKQIQNEIIWFQFPKLNQLKKFYKKLFFWVFKHIISNFSVQEA